jgi:predicted alpha/beta-hydrolase family hydrolase
VERPLLLLAPGAGAPSSSPWMVRWTARLAALGDVVPLDYPYAREGRRRPDRLTVLVAAHRAALAAARAGRRGPIVLAGKSMGGRIGCHVALEDRVDALVCLGYPLRGASGALRDEVLLALRTPVIFVQGTRDPLCPLDALEDVRRRMAAPSALHVVPEGDHGLVLRARALAAQGTTQDEVDARALAAIAAFLREHRILPPDVAAGGAR